MTYEAEPAVTDFAAAKAKAREPDDVLGEPHVIEIGDAEKALAAARPSRRRDLLDAAPEPQRHRAARRDRRLGRRASSSCTTPRRWSARTAGSLAQVFGLKADQVRVLSPFVGGGFGGKGLWSHQILAAAAAKLAGRPVRLVLSREGVYRVVGGRTHDGAARGARRAARTAGSTR